MKATTIILCADDFGISGGVNRAILDLAAKKRLSAVSCMSLGHAWETGAKALKALHGEGLGVGLHLTLTYLPPLVKELGARHPSEKKLLLQSWTRGLDPVLLKKEIHAQFERFVNVWGTAPDFIDGHQHVHVLPVVRDIVLSFRKLYAPQSWMRNVVDLTALTDNRKYGILAVMGWQWREMLKREGIPHNEHLRGTYDYAKPVDYAALMRRWGALDKPTLIYCHPGFPDETLAWFDTVLEPRRKEYDFINSDAFKALDIHLASHP